MYVLFITYLYLLFSHIILIYFIVMSLKHVVDVIPEYVLMKHSISPIELSWESKQRYAVPFSIILILFLK